MRTKSFESCTFNYHSRAWTASSSLSAAKDSISSDGVYIYLTASPALPVA